MLDRDIKLLANADAVVSPSWRPTPLKAKSGRPATHGSMTTSLSQAALVGLPALSPSASASLLELGLEQPSIPATPSPKQQLGRSTSALSFTSARSRGSTTSRAGSQMAGGVTNVGREGLDGRDVPSMQSLQREALWDETGHQVDMRRPWNSKNRGYRAPWYTYKSDEECRFYLDQHPEWVATAPGVHNDTFERPAAFFENPLLPSSKRRELVVVAAHAEDETGVDTTYDAAMSPPRSVSRTRTRRRLPPISPHKRWDDRFPVARELDRCPTSNGIRVGLNNRLGVTSSSFSTSRRDDSTIQRYVMLGPRAVY